MNDGRGRTIARMSPCDECGCPNRYECGCAARGQERLFPVGEPVVDGDALAAEVEAWLASPDARKLVAPGKALTLARRAVVVDGEDGVTGAAFAALLHAAGAGADAVDLAQLPAMLGLPEMTLAVSRHGSDERALAAVEIEGCDGTLLRWDELTRLAGRAWLPADCSSIVQTLLRHCHGCTAEGGATTTFLVSVCAGVVAWHSAGRPVVAVAGPLELGMAGDARALPPLHARAARPGTCTDLAGAALVNTFWQPSVPAGRPALALSGESGYGATVCHGALYLAG